MISRLVIVFVAVWSLQGIYGLPWPTTIQHGLHPADSRVFTRALTEASIAPYHQQQGFSREDLSISRQTEDELQRVSSGGRYKRSTSEQPHEMSPIVTYQTSDNDEAATADDSAVYPSDGDTAGQHFFPSYFPSFGSSRQQQYYQNPSPRPSVRSNNFQTVANVYQAEADTTQSNLLGSGNFGVIRGGTYYNDADREHGQASEYDNHQVYSPYYNGNGHGRPSFYKGGGSNPRPQQQGTDFFANFRDFADINAPTKSSYSELYVVYVNKNATRQDREPVAVVRGEKPKNIIEQLALIERDEEEPAASTVPQKKKKLSASKSKLARTFKIKREKVKKTTTPKDLYEPLLALS